MNKPSPVPKFVVCAVCDLDWPSHGPDPTLMDCIRLLKAKQYTQPYYPWYHNQVRYYGGNVTLGSNMSNTVSSSNVEYRTPKEA